MAPGSESAARRVVADGMTTPAVLFGAITPEAAGAGNRVAWLTWREARRNRPPLSWGGVAQLVRARHS